MDVRVVIRTLGRSLPLSLAVAATLGTGTAALTLTFGVVNAALFRQPPFADASRLAMLYLERNPRGEPPGRQRWSFPRFELLRESQESFDDVASYSPATLTLSSDAGAEPVEAERVSASYFPVLGARALRGRLFTEAEDDPARPSPVVVIGEGLWRRAWGASPSALGRTIRVNGVPLTIVGILPRDFAGLTGRAELWVPRTMAPQLTYAEYLTTNQNFISAVGRLRRGVGPDEARTELAGLGARINRTIPSDPDDPLERVTAAAVSLNDARVDGSSRRSLWILLGGVALLHLLACANAANLLIGRAAARRREWAVRLALGSSTGRLFRHILGEGLLLGIAGGACGIALAARAASLASPPVNIWAPRNFYGSLAPFDTPAFGLAELVFGIAVTLASALVVAGLPAMTTLRLDLASGIRSGSRAIASGAMRLGRPSARGIIVGVEAALALLLVIAAGLLIDSFQRMREASIGVDTDHVLTFGVIPSEARVPPDAAPAFVARLLDALVNVPGVRSATVDGGAPLAGSASNVLYIAGRPTPGPGEAPPVLRHYVAPDHFVTLGIPLRRGRAFTPADDADAPRVTVISETAARRFWPDEDPIGRRVWFAGSGFDSPEMSAEIVGVVGDVVYAPLDRQPNLASFYTPYRQFTYASRTVFLRTAGDPMSVVPGVRDAIATVDPDLAIRDVQPLGEVVRGSWARHRFEAMLFGAFGIVALLLAASGIFAVLSHAVAGRTREFGIRIALGADAGRVVGQVLREGMAFPAAGLIIGGAVSLAATRLLRSSLYGISPRDPRIFIGTVTLLLIVAAAACLVPAWRATRADPMTALRSE